MATDADHPVGDRAELTLRAAGPGDVAALVELIESAYRGEHSRVGWTTEADLLGGQRTDPEMLAAALAEPDIRMLLALGPAGEPVGCCQLQRRPDGAYFGMFAVQPDIQGRGVGDRLLTAAEALARDEWAAARMELYVISLRAELIAWYERRGYRRTDRHEPFPYGDTRFGVPLRDDLVFAVLEKDLGHRVDVGGLALHVETWTGQAHSSTPLLLLHGIGGSTRDWAGVSRELAGAVSSRVVAYDHRGHGTSGRAARPEYTFDHLVRDLETVVATLELAPLHLLGHSMGGVIALRYALAHPEAVRSLILMDTAAAPAAGDHLLSRLGMGALMEGIAAATALLRHGDHADPAALAALAAFGHELNAYPSMIDRLGEIRCPTTVIVGERDVLLRGAARDLAGAIEGARLAVIAGADHNPQASHPQAWLSAVERHAAF
ncbi:alpha/beta fold hydrolase [Parafrankia sp. FMc6]|uniref:alpha/beta fold hydrolase n=1 Tax=Parafrankia soli TaxID=2599596 RepID=UPI0034D799E0